MGYAVISAPVFGKSRMSIARYRLFDYVCEMPFVPYKVNETGKMSENTIQIIRLC